MRIAARCVAILIVVCLHGGAAGQDQQPLAVEDVAELVSAGVTSKRLVTLIEQHGVNFKMTEKTWERLRQAGADTVVLEAVEQAGLIYARKKFAEGRKRSSGQAEADLQRTAGRDGPEMIMVPAGEFWMGCNEQVDTECDDDEKPGQMVFVDAFHIDRTEVTVAQYGRCVDAGQCTGDGLTTPYRSLDNKAYPEWAWACNWDKPGRESHPINCITWQQARAYCRWAGKRLPTEVEWEKAARGTDGRKYPWGNRRFGVAGRVANVADKTAKRNRLSWAVVDGYDDGFYETAPVGSFPTGASPYGALDMIGNVWEWTADWYDVEHRFRSLRGGSWSDVPRFARVSSRIRNAPSDRYMVAGFRCAQ